MMVLLIISLVTVVCLNLNQKITGSTGKDGKKMLE